MPAAAAEPLPYPAQFAGPPRGRQGPAPGRCPADEDAPVSRPPIFAVSDYGAIEVEDRLGGVTHPVLVLAGRHDRTCVVEGGEAIAAGIPGAQLAVFEASGHLTFAEENEAYVGVVRGFLQSEP